MLLHFCFCPICNTIPCEISFIHRFCDQASQLKGLHMLTVCNNRQFLWMKTIFTYPVSMFHCSEYLAISKQFASIILKNRKGLKELYPVMMSSILLVTWPHERIKQKSSLCWKWASACKGGILLKETTFMFILALGKWQSNQNEMLLTSDSR